MKSRPLIPVNPEGLDKIAESLLNEKPVQQVVSILKKDKDGKPLLELTSLEKTVVNTSKQEEYNTLLRVYECGGWVWIGGTLPLTELNHWPEDGKETCVRVEDNFRYGNNSFYLKGGYKIISIQDFYDIQKITSNMIKEIDAWFDKS